MKNFFIGVGIFFLKKGGVNMVDVYVSLITFGLRKLTQVPAGIRGKVEEELTKLGLDGEGKPLKQEA